jgi:hypothetical protein
MKIVKQTPNILILLQLPWVAWFISLPFFLIALAALISEAQMSQLICQRKESEQGICRLTRVNFLGMTSTKTWQINEIQTIEIINESEQIRLLTPKGEITLMPFYKKYGRGSNRKTKQFVVKQMQAFFINAQKPELIITQDSRVMGYFDSILFTLLGLIWVIAGLNSIDIYKFDKISGCLIKKRRLFGKSIVKCQIQDIVSVLIDCSRTDKGKIYSIFLMTQTGKQIVINFGVFDNQLQGKQTAKEICTFLNLPEP